jgi:hypothetical protein
MMIPLTGAAIGEGIPAVGSAAEQIRGHTPPRTPTEGQVVAAVATGAATAVLGRLGGWNAKKPGDRRHRYDACGGGRQTTGRGEPHALRGAWGVQGGLPEELPLSVSEQVIQNPATGRPLWRAPTPGPSSARSRAAS